MEFDIGTLAERVVLTPAERAVLVEQAETTKVNLDTFIAHCKEGTAGDAIKSFISVLRCSEYMNGLVNHKIGLVLQEDHDLGREH